MAALDGATIPDGALTFVSLACLVAMHQIVLPQVREGGGLLPYLNMVRRQWQWMRHGRVGDSTGDPDLEAELLTYRRQMEAGLPAAERLLETMELAAFVNEAAEHRWQRIQGLQQGRRHSEPSRL